MSRWGVRGLAEQLAEGSFTRLVTYGQCQLPLQRAGPIGSFPLILSTGCVRRLLQRAAKRTQLTRRVA